MDDHQIDSAKPYAERAEMDGLDDSGRKAEAAHGNAIDPVLEKRVLRKLDRSLIPLVTALCKYIDSSGYVKRH